MKKHILYVVHSLNLGGTERLVVDMSMNLSNHYHISILCLDEPGIWANQVRDNGVPVHSFYRQPGLDFRIPFKLARYAKENKIDLIHAHQCTPWFYSGLSRLIYSKPKLLFEEHGRLYPETNNMKRKLFNKIVLQQLTSKTTAVSKDIKQRLFKYEGLGLNNIEVIYNGTNPSLSISDRQRINLRHKFGFRDHDVVVGTIGRLDQIKNLPLFINGFKKVKSKFQDLKGLIIGDGPEAVNIKKMIKNLNLENEIILTGYREDASELSNIIDVFTLTSFSEGTSIALLESMAASVPAIVTDVGGNPEIVKENQTGIVVPSNNLKAFSNSLLFLVKNKKTMLQMGSAAKQRFDDFFTIDNMIDRYSEIYKELLGY